MAHDEMKTLIDGLSVFSHTSLLEASVTIIHGADDPVISSEESVQLHEHLRAANKKSHLVISPLLDHSTLTFEPRMIAELFKLTNGLSFYFNGKK
jgi:dipeptidyl aminopeptidase/acylaminoacyl peptidase